MKDQKEVQTAWEIWNLTNRLNDLLFDHYEEQFSDIWLEEGTEQDPLLQSLGTPDIKHEQGSIEMQEGNQKP